jgi:hypothetical protein
MKKRQMTKRQFAICIRSDDPDLLTPRMIYEVLPDENAAKSHYLRVVDNEGEDYLSPADYLALIDFPRTIEDALVRTLPLPTRIRHAGVRLRPKVAHRSV